MSDPLVLLARADKWFLSATDGIVFAPPFPRWLDSPGFWDEATLHHYSFAPLFTVTGIDGDGREIAMRPVARRWTPAELTVDYRLANGMMASEVRTVQPGGVFASEWLVQGLRHAPLHLIAWTAHDAADIDRWSIGYDGGFAFHATVYDERGESLLVRAELACYGETASYASYLASRVQSAPRWDLTPFVEKWAGEGLPNEIRIEGSATNAMLFGAVHRELAVSTDGAWATFAMRLTPLELPLRAGAAAPAPASPITLVTSGASSGIPAHAATLGGSSRRRWNERFARSPDFRSSDPHLEHYYWYRWYGLWLNAIEHDAGAIGAPAMCEGIGELHTPSAHATPGNVRELRWLDSPDFARGAMRALFAHQRDDGSVPARIFADHRSVLGVAQSNWGDAILALDAVWPDDAFLREMYGPLSRYADWLLLWRDSESSGLIDIMAPREVGERHSSRFEGVDPGGARDELSAGARLKGVDVTTYAYSLARALETMAHRAGHPPDARRWRVARERIGAALRTRMWDAGDEMFSDVDPASGDRTRVKSAHIFYPYATDLITDPDIAGLERHLLDPAEFWTPFPVPVTAVDDPFFSAYGEWKGQRQSQPWNGRVWPAVNSSVMDALGRAAASHSPALRVEAALFLRRFVRMMFHAGDLGRPNAFEHYNPLTGQASVFRGLDDVQRSWVADHIVSYVMGIRPHDGGITIDPFPFGLERAEISGVHARGRNIDIRILDSRVVVTIDGASREGVLGEGLEIPD